MRLCAMGGGIWGWRHESSGDFNGAGIARPARYLAWTGGIWGFEAGGRSNHCDSEEVAVAGAVSAFWAQS